MRCKICNKIFGSKHGYQSHLRLTHKLSQEERLEIIKEAFPPNKQIARYGELIDRMKRGELLTKEEFAIVRACRSRHNRSKSAYYS